MSLAYFPLYVGDYERDTPHLTFAEDGAYNRLLRLCWLSPGCCLPNDREWIYRRVRATTDDDRALVDRVLDEFFAVRRGKIYNPRLLKEHVQAAEKYERRKNAGKLGGAAKALKNKPDGASNARALLKQPEPEPEPEPEYIHNTTRHARAAEIVAIPGGKTRDLDALVNDLSDLCARANGGNLPTGWVGAEVGIIVGHWLTALGLTSGEVLSVAQRQLAHWGKPPYGPRSWDGAMAKFAGAKSAPPPEVVAPRNRPPPEENWAARELRRMREAEAND